MIIWLEKQSVSLKSAPVTVLDSEPDPLDLVEFLRPE